MQYNMLFSPPRVVGDYLPNNYWEKNGISPYFTAAYARHELRVGIYIVIIIMRDTVFGSVGVSII